jgi:MFS family permease
MWSWLLYFVTDRMKTLGQQDASWASAITFFIIAAGTPACIAAGSIADRVGRPVTTIVLLVISGACAASIGFAFDAQSWIFMLIGLVWGASVVADSAQFSAIITESGAKFVGTALTVQLGLGFGVTIIAILTLPAVAQWIGGWRWVFLALVPGPVIGGAAMATLRRLDRRRMLT